MKPEQVEGHRAAHCDQFGQCESRTYASVMERVSNEGVPFRQANRQPQVGQKSVEDLCDEKQDDDEIAEAHGGAITLENRAPGPGCRAELTLPL